MSFRITQRGGAEIRRRLAAIQRAGKGAMRQVATTSDGRFCEAMGRRDIPERTGRLRKSLTSPGHPDHVLRVNRESVTIGTDVPYAQYQQKRIRGLSRSELQYIFRDPVLEIFRTAIEGRAG